MKSSETVHIDELVRVAEGAPSDRDCVIQDSWRRCVSDHKLDPAILREAYILPSEELRPRREAMDEFLRTARFGLESLYGRVAGLGYVLLLTDAKGVTVDFIGDPTFDNHLRKAGLYLGSDWNEERAGTCGVGTCIATGEALTVHQTDHFDAMHIPLTCTSTPVYDSRGELAAVLDISALCSPSEKSSQALALEFVKSYAARIENAYLLNSFRREWILKLSRSPEFADVDPDYILALDAKGRIIGFNHKAQRLLAKEAGVDWRQPSALLGKPFTNLFDCNLDALTNFVYSRPTEQRAIRLRHSEDPLFGHALLPPVIFSSKSGDSSDRPLPEPLRTVSGGDPVLKGLVSRAAKLVNARMSLLIHGETGTGKEYFAKALHSASVRADRRFVAVNCAALPESLIESELFGHEAGSFTGASSKGKRGLVVEADGGTLFLDEIGDMPLAAQTRLLRVLAEREVTPIGRTKPIPVDVRVIAATHRDLVELVKAGKFRDDLYFRLNGAIFTIPPLRQRADIDWLIDKLVAERGERDKQGYQLSEASRAAMHNYNWPGNIRELVNCIEYACAVCNEALIDVADLPEQVQSLGAMEDWTKGAPDIGSAEREQLLSTLQRHKWNISAVARELDMHRSSIYRQMRRFGIAMPFE